MTAMATLAGLCPEAGVADTAAPGPVAAVTGVAVTDQQTAGDEAVRGTRDWDGLVPLVVEYLDRVLRAKEPDTSVPAST